ncbi:hypothetical protein [Streptomyces sp. UNOB3_S3]|uniref:hypothetical protein n=1 Tax=Streptomyces sp. UNOB3_S3 TaxID=2871682 RepID=UPI001E3A63FD|nr:hypothetical protein [Streptomyces sp. UNOB3_S3]MCC3777228.1 hypothetical protein [Streptomyces sp. UNOB3_S3]
MTSQHSRLTPDLPPIVEIPDLPGAAGSTEGEVLAGPGHGSGAHQEGDGRHERAGDGSGG